MIVHAFTHSSSQKDEYLIALGMMNSNFRAILYTPSRPGPLCLRLSTANCLSIGLTVLAKVFCLRRSYGSAPTSWRPYHSGPLVVLVV